MKLKIWGLGLVMAVALLMPAVTRAHDGHLHKALGTVASVDGEHVTIKTTAGKSLVIMLDRDTKVTRGTTKLDVAAVKIGERVSVDYMEENSMNMAHAIKLATGVAAKK